MPPMPSMPNAAPTPTAPLHHLPALPPSTLSSAQLHYPSEVQPEPLLPQLSEPLEVGDEVEVYAEHA